MTDDRETETSRRGFLGGSVSSAVGLFVGKARGAVSDGLPKIEMGDAGSDPESNGVIARNGDRLKAYSAGRLIDFADALYPGEDFDGQGTSSFSNLQSLSTESASITNFTDVEAYRSTDTSTISANTWTTVADTETNDNRNEQDSSFIITPTDTGRYHLSATCWLDGGASGDRVEIAINNQSGGNPLNARTRYILGGTGLVALQLNSIVQLQSGDGYRVEVRNKDSSFTVSSTNNKTGYILQKKVVEQ